MKKKNGWEKQCADSWDELYILGTEADFEYKGKKYGLELCADPARIVEFTGNHNRKVIATFKTEEEFYNAIVFGKPIAEIFDEAVVTMVW